MSLRRNRPPHLKVRKYQMLPPARLYEVQRALQREIARRLRRVPADVEPLRAETSQHE
jgi:hypothetical protein